MKWLKMKLHGIKCGNKVKHINVCKIGIDKL